ncbi:sulfotransferase domain-containing protein [Candidatus Pelagibacter sp.]|nr:sulfotransferase domain-containing protein [Candidatus Pelagibacter sp.]
MIIWLASYPKSGNTWLRFFIISLLMGDKTNLNLNHLKAIIDFPNVKQFKGLISEFSNLNEVAKNWITAQKKINSDKSLKFFKTHNMFGKLNGFSFTNYENTLGAIHIVRDPRNIITSLKNHWSLETYDETKTLMFNDNQILTLSKEEKEKFKKYNTMHSLPQMIGSWKTNYISWKKMDKNYLFVKYENLIKNTKIEFTKIAEFISGLTNIKFNDEQIDNAIKLSSFEKLEAMEKENGFIESAINKKGYKNKFFYLGPKNKWQNILDSKTSRHIEEEFKIEMKELGYL